MRNREQIIYLENLGKWTFSKKVHNETPPAISVEDRLI